MRKQVKLLAVLSLAMILVPTVASANGVLLGTRPLIAGQHTDVGEVNVYLVGGDTVRVTFEIDVSDWCLKETHAYVGPVGDKVPKAPGQFPQAHSLSCVKFDYFDFPLAEIGAEPGDPLNVAAHSVVCPANCDLPFNGVCPDLESADEFLAYPGNATNAYFDVWLSNAGPFDGLYPGWCCDAGSAVRRGSGPVKVVCSYAAEAADYIPNEENLDQANYILNHVDFGATRNDIQEALWRLLWDPLPRGSAAVLPDDGTFNEATVLAILADAAANGEGFVPGPGQVVLVILVQLDPEGNKTGQNHLIPIPVPRDCETAWATAPGDTGGLAGWGTFFTVPD